MSKRSQEKRKARSKEKKRAHRKMQGASPLSRLAGVAEEACECWMTTSPDTRMVSMHVMRPVRGGLTVAAFFLVDYDCIGLKDAFYRLGVDCGALRETIRQGSLRDGVRLIRIDVVRLRAVIAGAIRWTREHPFFRMPPDTERCLKIIGGAGEIDAADTQKFGVDGKLIYVGRQIDLERRLVGMSINEFVARPDVEVLFHLGDETFADEDAEEFEDEEEYSAALEDEAPFDPEYEQAEEDLLAMREQLKHKMLDQVRRWCFANAILPHAELEAAVDLTLAASMEGIAEDDEDRATEQALRAHSTLVSLETPEKRAAIKQARAQLKQFADSFPTREAYMQAVGLDMDDMDMEETEDLG